MNDRNTHRTETFLRVDQLYTSITSRIPAESYAVTLFARLRQIIAQINAATSQQTSGSRSAQAATVSKSLAREALVEALMRISRTARGMRRAVPGLEEKFRAPGKVGEQELLAIARSYAADALPFKDEFTKRGLAPDFIVDLNERIEDFEHAIAQQTQGGTTQVSATATIEDLIAEGMEILRELDPVMRNLFEDDPAMLAAWETARHVERDPRRQPAPPQPTA